MTTIVTRAGKGSPLTHTEVDTNFTNLNTNKLEAGAIALGSAATPSISFTGDTNTGIYSPGADQVAVATNGVARVVVNNTGLGVGIPPTRSIDVYRGDAGQAILRLSDVNSRNVELRSPDGTGNQGGIGTVTNHDFIGFTGNTERLRITSAGLVGIGASSPTEKLTINGNVAFNTNDQYITFNSFYGSPFVGSMGSLRAVNSAYGSEVAAINFYQTGGNTADILFRTGLAGSSVERMRIDSSGRVGIGTTSPNALLDVRSATTWVGDGTTDAFLQFNQSATAANRWHIGAGSGNAFIFYKGTYGTGVETARIDSSGRLLVGTTSKSATASTTAKGVIGLGGGGALICAEASGLANNGTVDITVSTGGVHYFTGLLQVNNINAANGLARTQSLISVLGDTQFGTITTSTLHTADGSVGQSFTITYAATGILRFTNTSGSTCNVQINYMGGGINAS